MRKTLAFYLLFCLMACQNEATVETEQIRSNEPPAPTQLRDEVVISLADTSLSFFTNLLHDEFQDKPDMLFLGSKQKRWSITIPTTDSIKILGGDPMLSFFYQLTLHRGDSLIIRLDPLTISPDRTINYPIFELSNSRRPADEINFDHKLYRKNLSTNAFGLAAGVPSQNNVRDNERILKNGISLLDSLQALNQISTDFYHSRKRKLLLDQAREKIYVARAKQAELSLDTLGVGLQEEKSAWDQEYLSFLRVVILYKHFENKKRIKNTKQFDFVATKETFLTPKLRLALLGSYLKSIYFVEKAQFPVYLKKLQAIDTAHTYTTKWENHITKEGERERLNQQQMTGNDVLSRLLDDSSYVFEEILKRERGKIVLVDFWASWCAPCRQEMPAVHRLQEEIGKDRLAIVQISIDQKYTAWERASKMENINQEKHNYIISNWESSQLYKRFQIKTIPRYLLFDKMGQLLDDDAPRPSSEALAALIQANL